jgi:hypothetical protein
MGESLINLDEYNDLLRFWDKKQAELKEYKGVNLKNEKGKTISLRFTLAGKRVAKSCNESFTESGMIRAVEKAKKVYEALQRIVSVCEFENWYRVEILRENEVKDDRLTYREIFERIEKDYWSGNDKNTGEPRTKPDGSRLPNHKTSFKRTHLDVFNKFSNWDKYPSYDELESVLFSWQKGTKTFKDTYGTIKKIASYFPKSLKADCLEKLDVINPKQTKFRDKTNVTEKDFLEWHKQAYEQALSYRNPQIREARLNWLWVASMAFVYGLRPTEITAVVNLTESYKTKRDKVIKAICDPTNKELLLVLGDLTYYGIKIKTGGRVCKPLTLDREILEQLKIQDVRLPIYNPDPESDSESLCVGFAKTFRQRIISMGCPTTRCYDFRHAGNAKGEKSGIPQEIRARSMGHSKEVNDRIYRNETDLDLSVDILINHSRQSLSYKEALFELESHGIALNDSQVQSILKIIYRL